MKPDFGVGTFRPQRHFALTKNGHFTGVLRGRRGRTIAEQDKAGSLGPAGSHRTATPTGNYGYVEGIPGIHRERSGSKPGVSRLFPADFQAFIGRDSGIGTDYGHGQMAGS